MFWTNFERNSQVATKMWEFHMSFIEKIWAYDKLNRCYQLFVHSLIPFNRYNHRKHAYQSEIGPKDEGSITIKWRVSIRIVLFSFCFSWNCMKHVFSCLHTFLLPRRNYFKKSSFFCGFNREVKENCQRTVKTSENKRNHEKTKMELKRNRGKIKR